jgi:hypothetical protein
MKSNSESNIISYPRYWAIQGSCLGNCKPRRIQRHTWREHPHSGPRDLGNKSQGQIAETRAYGERHLVTMVWLGNVRCPKFPISAIGKFCEKRDKMAHPKPRRRRRTTDENLTLVREGLGCFKALGTDVIRIGKRSWKWWCTDNDITAWEGLHTTYKTLLKDQHGDLKHIKLPETFRSFACSISFRAYPVCQESSDR